MTTENAPAADEPRTWVHRDPYFPERLVISHGTKATWATLSVPESHLRNLVEALGPRLHGRQLTGPTRVSTPAPEPDDREALIDALVMSPLSDSAGTLLAPIRAIADAIIAAGFRRHPEPVKPSREDVIEAVRDTIDRHGPTDLGYDETAALATAIADRALDTLWPGRSVAEVKAEGWDEGFEAGATFVPQTSGIPHDPPRNPYLIENGDDR